ncbi:hypothetical protein ACLIYP_30295, partial [Streptomyces nanhaiensis]
LLIDRLGLGLAGLVNILDPDRIILGGLHRALLEADAGRQQSVSAERRLWGRDGGVPVRACAVDCGGLVASTAARSGASPPQASGPGPGTVRPGRPSCPGSSSGSGRWAKRSRQ